MDFVPLCEPWPVTWCCDLDLASPAVTGMAVQAASEYVWAQSGRQHGSCSVLLRPCRSDCQDSYSGYWWNGTWPTTSPWPAWPWRVDLACGRCIGDCSCSAVSTLRLPVYAQSIAQVLIDGAEIPASGYAFYDNDKLVRTGGEAWPSCQDWSVPVSGVGAWSVTPVFGEPVPELGRLAVGELACLIVKHCTDPSCRLPAGLQSQTRAGSTYVYFDPVRLKEIGSTGLRMVDRFLDMVNPSRLDVGARIWDPDDMTRHRRPT